MTRSVHIAFLLAGLFALAPTTVVSAPPLQDAPEAPRGDRGRHLPPERPATNRPAPHRRLFEGTPARRAP